MLRPIDDFFLQKEEPLRSCLQFLREHILQQNSAITEAWKYKLPFYCYNGKPLCYLWIHKKYHQPYIGFMEGKRMNHPDLLIENRSRIKILLIDPNIDIPIKKINTIIKTALSFCMVK